MNELQDYILSIDQGTTSTRAILVDKKGEIVSNHQVEFNQYFPQPGWVEHDAEEIWGSVIISIFKCIDKAKIPISQIKGIGITNQRETTVAWNNETGEPIYNAIVWQDRRTAKYCSSLINDGLDDLIKDKTGLVLDAYFSASKMRWILKNVPEAKTLAKEGKLAFGTIDSWILYKLTKGEHKTDYSNASRTMLFNIHTGMWDQTLLDMFEIPFETLPKVEETISNFGYTYSLFLGFGISVYAMIGDQQASLFGQHCLKKGDIKTTYGTGCFIVANTGADVISSNYRLISTIAWKINNKITYAVEGSVFVGGAAVQWLRDNLGIIEKSSDVEVLASTVEDNGGVYFVPAFTGLGAPYWDSYARGSLFGLTRGSNKGHIARATLESICFQVNDVLQAIKSDTGQMISSIKVDGGPTDNSLLMQFQSNISNIQINPSKYKETTALGAAYLAGVGANIWTLKEIKSFNKSKDLYSCNMIDVVRRSELKQWQKALKKSQNWIDID